MTRMGVCIMLLLLVSCAPGTEVIYGSSIRPGGGLPSITTMGVGRLGAQSAPAAPAAPADANTRAGSRDPTPESSERDVNRQTILGTEAQ